MFHVDDPILVAGDKGTEDIWNKIGTHMMLKGGQRFNKDTPVMYLGMQYLKYDDGERKIIQNEAAARVPGLH